MNKENPDSRSGMNFSKTLLFWQQQNRTLRNLLGGCGIIEDLKPDELR